MDSAGSPTRRPLPRAEFVRGVFVRSPADSPACGEHILRLRCGGVEGHGWQASVLRARPGRENGVDGAGGAVLRRIANGVRGTSWVYARTYFTLHAARAVRRGGGVRDLEHGKPVNRALSAPFASGGSVNAPDLRVRLALRRGV